jgi:hypothetical protein
MNTTATPQFWSEEPSKTPGRRRIRARIGGLHCSLCTGRIERALGRKRGVGIALTFHALEGLTSTIGADETRGRAADHLGDSLRRLCD